MAEAESRKRSNWLPAAITGVILLILIAIFAVPTAVSCTTDPDGFGSCVRDRLADVGLLPPAATPDAAETDVAADDSATPADEAETPAEEDPVAVSAPDFGVRVEPDGSLLVAGSGATGDKVEIYANGVLLGTADVQAGGDWVLVPDAPLPPGGYELTIIDTASDEQLAKSFVIAIDEDMTSEPLVVASEPGQASEILQGMGQEPVEVAEADTPAATEDTPEEVAAGTDTAEGTSDDETLVVADADAEQQINDAAAEPEGASELMSAPEIDTAETPATDEPETQVAGTEAAPETEEDMEVAMADPMDDVVGDLDALEQQIESLRPQVAPSIDAIEIDQDRNFFAGTGEEGATIRLYVDNVFIGDTVVENGAWLLETDGVLENRTQRVRVDQLVGDTAEVGSRAEVDFIFEAGPETPEGAEPETVVADTDVRLPSPDFGIDTDQPVEVDVAQAPEGAPSEEQPTDVAAATDVQVPTPDFGIDTEQPADIEVAGTQDAGETIETAEVEVPTPDFGIDTNAPADIEVAESTDAAPSSVDTAGTDVVVPTPNFGIDTDQPVAVPFEFDTADAGGSDTGTDEGQSGNVETADAGAVSVPSPDFSIDTGLPVTVVPGGDTATTDVAATDAPTSEATPEEMEVAAADPVIGDDELPEIEEPEVPQLVAVPVGDPEAGRFASGKAIIRRGDNLWTIARRVYGQGIRYTQIYGANRGQIRDPNLIYPGQVFDLPAGDSGELTK